MNQDPDVGLTPRERTRQALHRSIGHIVRAWEHAHADADARGFPAGAGEIGQSVGELTSVEAAALRPSVAVAWLAELRQVQLLLFTGRIVSAPHFRTRLDHGSFYLTNPVTFEKFAHVYANRLVNEWPPWSEETCRRTILLANQACMWWPPPPGKGTVIAGVTVGQRGNTVEMCVLCGDPIPDKIKRIDGQAFHATSCYYRVWRQRRQLA